MSLRSCISVYLVESLYNHINKVDPASPMSLYRSVSLTVVELAVGGSATNSATPSSCFVIQP